MHTSTRSLVVAAAVAVAAQVWHEIDAATYQSVQSMRGSPGQVQLVSPTPIHGLEPALIGSILLGAIGLAMMYRALSHTRARDTLSANR